MNTVVTKLFYSLVFGEGIDYKNAEVFKHEEQDFSVRIAGNEAVAKMKTSISDISQARRTVELFLRSWEIVAGLAFRPGEMTFKFKRAEVSHTNSDGNTTLQVHSLNQLHFLSAATIHVSRGKYPAPPSRFRVSPDVETLFRRYEGYCMGREPLSSMAYMCLTVVQTTAGNRKKAGRKYSISNTVLNNIGRLSTESGGPAEARKYHAGPEFSMKERTWLEEAVKMLIGRLGQYAYDPPAVLSQITMSDLPSIT